jgi:hypothetical protein
LNACAQQIACVPFIVTTAGPDTVATPQLVTARTTQSEVTLGRTPRSYQTTWCGSEKPIPQSPGMNVIARHDHDGEHYAAAMGCADFHNESLRALTWVVKHAVSVEQQVTFRMWTLGRANQVHLTGTAGNILPLVAATP